MPTIKEVLEKKVEDGHATKETKNVLVWVNMDSEPVQVMKLSDVYTFVGNGIVQVILPAKKGEEFNREG